MELGWPEKKEKKKESEDERWARLELNMSSLALEWEPFF